MLPEGLQVSVVDQTPNAGLIQVWGQSTVLGAWNPVLYFLALPDTWSWVPSFLCQKGTVLEHSALPSLVRLYLNLESIGCKGGEKQCYATVMP